MGSYRDERDPYGHNRDWNPNLRQYDASDADLRSEEEEARGDTRFPPEPNPNHISDPGFPEEEHRVGAILRQSEQFGLDHYAAEEGHYEDYDKWSGDNEHQEAHES